MGIAERVVERYAKSKARVNVQIRGWKGVRKIPKKDIEAFRKDLRSIREAGLTVLIAGGPTVQLKKDDLSKLDPILKKHGLIKGSIDQKPKRHIYIDD